MNPPNDVATTQEDGLPLYRGVAAATTAFRDVEALSALARCILAQEVRPALFIVVDNSPFSLLDRLKSSLGGSLPDWFLYEHHPENLGIGDGIARIFDLCGVRGIRHVWLFDQDSEPEPTALKQLVSQFECSDMGLVGLLASLPINRTTGLPVHGLTFRRGCFEACERANCDEKYSCDAVITAGMLISLEAVRCIALPVEFFIDLFDYELCLRLRDAGFQIVVVPASRIRHGMGAHAEFHLPFGLRALVPGYSELRWYYYVRNLVWLELKRSQGWDKVWAFLRGFTRIRTCVKDSIVPRVALGKVLAALRGFVDGVRGRLGPSLKP